MESSNIKVNLVGTSSTVHINGKSYDITTGQIISAFRSANQKTTQVIDGFVSRPSKNNPAETNRQHIKSGEVHKRPQKTRTLMRGGLKKPKSDSSDISGTSVRRHPQIARFSNSAKSGQASHTEAVSGEIVRHRPLKAAGPAAAVTAPLPSMIASASHQKLERLLDEALTRADAHKEALRYHAARHFWQRRWFNGPRKWVVIGIIAIAVLGSGLYAWGHVPQVSMKVASLKAHFSAAVPSYQPEGYQVAGPAKAVSGAVSIQYKAAADQARTYDITEQPSDFTSGMVSQNVVPKGATVQTSQVQGNTVYIYGSSNDAAWVNNGVLYTIKNHSGLSSDQLIQIVSGLNP